MQKQTRRLQKFINPDIMPVDQDQWDRLVTEIESIPTLSEKYGNIMWAIIGFCGSIVLSNAFYLFSSPSDLTIVYASSTLLIGLLLSSWILHKNAQKDKNSQKEHISRIKNILVAIKRRIHTEQAELFTTADLEDYSDSTQKEEGMVETIKDSPIIKKDVKDILSKLNKSSNKGYDHA